MMTLYAVGILPLSFSKACSSDNRSSDPYQIESQLVSLDSATAWINSEHLSAKSLEGKVVLVEFCTYTCINWLRTLPYVRSWSEKYKKNGFVVIGVHTPEFAFEAEIENVRKAIGNMNISFPVAIDNKRSIWNGFDNEYWPALYFIDAKGKIRHTQFGEAGYEQSERVIQQLLKESGSGEVAQDLVPGIGDGVEAAPDLPNLQSAEQYLGYYRSDNFASRGGAAGMKRVFAFPAKLKQNQWAVSGAWTLDEYFVQAGGEGSKLAIRFHARDLHLVMGASVPGREIRFRVYIDGKPVTADHGIDLDDAGNGIIREQRLYQLIRQRGSITDREFIIEFLDPGAEAFSFTFG